MVKYLLSFFSTYSKAKPFPGITNWLVTNPMFRRLAMNYHAGKEQATEDVDKWLEKELLTKEQYDRLYPEKRLDTRDANTTTGKKIDGDNYTNK